MASHNLFANALKLVGNIDWAMKGMTSYEEEFFYGLSVWVIDASYALSCIQHIDETAPWHNAAPR